MKWTIRKRSTALTRTIFSISDLDCSHEKAGNHIFSIIEAPDWINIVALTPDREILFVKQHRLGTDQVTIETPAGLIDSGEEPLHAAERELREETGYEAEKIIHLKSLRANPAMMNNTIHFFLALGCRKIGGQSLDMQEDIEVIRATIEETIRMMRDNIIDHSIIVTALSLFFQSGYFHEERKSIF
jgi:8-oxo-dGTP pyrophosphatase MutT (NUDIX family)